MRAYWGSGCMVPRVLTSAVDEGEWSASHTDPFTPGKEPLVSPGQEAG
jgi:hypothetical protein